MIKPNLLLVFGILLENYRCMPNTVLKCGKAARYNAHSLSQIPESENIAPYSNILLTLSNVLSKMEIGLCANSL